MNELCIFKFGEMAFLMSQKSVGLLQQYVSSIMLLCTFSLEKWEKI